MTQPFQRGDRVVTRIALPGVPQGTPGRIVQILGEQREQYWVEFDDRTLTSVLVAAAVLAHPHDHDTT